MPESDPIDADVDSDDSNPAEENSSPSPALKNPQTIARILGLLLFGLLFWLQSPPVFLRTAGWASYVFVVILWLGELLVYAICIAGVFVLLIFTGSHVVYLLRRTRRWFRLQEIRSWRAKRACNYQNAATDKQRHEVQ